VIAGVLLLAAFAAAPAPFQDGARAFHARKIYAAPGSERPWLEDAWLVVEKGRVTAVVQDRSELPPLLPVVELGDAVVVPGLVAADSTIAGQGGGQGDRAIGADRRALDDFDLYADRREILARGVTAVYLSPARDRLVGGRGAVVKTSGDHRVLAPVTDLRVSLEPSAFSPPRFFRPPIPPSSDNPIRPPSPQPGSSRAGAMLALRETVAEALEGGAALDPPLAALRDFFRARGRLRVSATSLGEVEGALELASEWKTPLLIDGAGQADSLAERIAAAGAGVLFKVPLFLSHPSRSPDWTPPAADALRKLADQGIPLAVAPGGDAGWSHLLAAAAAAVGYGLREDQALAAITSVPARLLGVGDRVGSLLPGFEADFAVLTGEPLDPGTSVRRVYVEGRRAWSRPDPEEETATVLRAGTVWTGEGPPLTGGAEVLLRGGRIVAVGRSVPHPPGAKILDAGSSAHVTPGFIDAQGNLGMGGRLDARLLVGRIAEGSAFREDWLAVARSGVTTMVVAPRRIPGEGARLQAVKTAAVGSRNAFLAGHDVVRFDLTGGDRPARVEGLRKTLERGKKYFEKWEKYRKNRAEWEKKEAGKKSGEREESEAALRKRLAGTLEKKKAAAKEEETAEGEEEVEEAPKKSDPINGLWHAVISSPMIPEPVSVFFRLHHDGTALHAVAWPEEDPSQTAEADGTFEDPEFQFEIPTNFGSVSISGEIDAEDHLNCNVNVGGLGSVDFEADRIEVEAEGAGGAAPRKRRKKGEGPQPPSISWSLEGLRSLFEGRGVALVAADRADEIRAAVETFREFKLPVRILGGGEAWKVGDLLRKEKVGVVVGPDVVQREKGRDVVPAARLLEQGIATAFQSGAGIGARFLPDSLALATRYGLGEEEALRGITSAAASILGIGDRVGRLAPGLDGDAVILNGPPFDLRSRVLHVFVNGREVPRE